MFIVPIRKEHKRKAFDCGKPKVNAFLHEKGLAEAYGATWVMVPHENSDDIVGFCTLRPDVEAEDEWDETATKEVYITVEWFGIDIKYKNQRLGRRLFQWIITQALRKAGKYPVAGLILIPLDNDALGWYMSLKYGFVELDGIYLYLSTEAMRLLPPLDSINPKK